MPMRSAGTVLVLLTSGTLAARPATAQIIPVRTVPVASGDQFLILPSSSVAMGGVRVAIDDTIADGWTNPAKGVLAGETSFFASPALYSISRDGGGGRTLPLGGLLAGTRWVGGAVLSLQQIDNSRSRGEPPWLWSSDQPRRLSDTSSRNLYASGYLARRLRDFWSVGLGLSASQLHAMDGVDLLYANADRIEQSGAAKDFRLGLYRAGPSNRVSVVLVHSRLSMEHRVSYTQWIYDAVLQQPVLQQRVEKNQEESRTWGARIDWSRELATPGWRLGASATMNYRTHPSIPNYDVQEIPRDPGTTWAYEGALGVARHLGLTTFGVDIAFQPIWSDTWQEADAQDVIASGGTLHVGDRSIDNDFFFTNVMLRAGVSRQVRPATLRAGLEVRSYAYQLTQVDYVNATDRKQDESWMEWAPALGVTFAFSGVDVSYVGRLTAGTGQPGTDRSSQVLPLAVLDQTAGSDFLVAPNGPLTLQDATVVTHQVSVRVPVR